MTELEVRTIAATTHGRYVVKSGPPSRLLIGFHGYAEDAEIHMAELRQIPGIDDWTVAAVQALHPFYTRSGAIVASWMTSQDRELAIDDNRAYVRQVVAQFPAPRHLVFAGFSQGVVMAYRAAAGSGASGLIALGGEMPPELMTSNEPLPPVLIGRGMREEWYTDAKMQNDLRVLSARTTVETFVYEGGHEWTDGFRDAVSRFLGTIAAAP